MLKILSENVEYDKIRDIKYEDGKKKNLKK